MHVTWQPRGCSWVLSSEKCLVLSTANHLVVKRFLLSSQLTITYKYSPSSSKSSAPFPPKSSRTKTVSTMTIV